MTRLEENFFFCFCQTAVAFLGNFIQNGVNFLLFFCLLSIVFFVGERARRVRSEFSSWFNFHFFVEEAIENGVDILSSLQKPNIRKAPERTAKMGNMATWIVALNAKEVKNHESNSKIFQSYGAND